MSALAVLALVPLALLLVACAVGVVRAIIAEPALGAVLLAAFTLVPLTVWGLVTLGIGMGQK